MHTVWPDGFIIFNNWPFRTTEICPKYKIFVKVCSQFCQMLNSYSRNGQTIFEILPKRRNFAKSGHTVCFGACSYYLSLYVYTSTISMVHDDDAWVCQHFGQFFWNKIWTIIHSLRRLQRFLLVEMICKIIWIVNVGNLPQHLSKLIWSAVILALVNMLFS